MFTGFIIAISSTSCTSLLYVLSVFQAVISFYIILNNPQCRHNIKPDCLLIIAKQGRAASPMVFDTLDKRKIFLDKCCMPDNLLCKIVTM